MIKKNTFLVSGSIAYDDIKILRSPIKRFFGGCAGNIAFNAKLLKSPCILNGIVGKDFGAYEKWLKKNKISTRYIFKDSSKKTSFAKVTNLSNGKQLVEYKRGAADLSPRSIKLFAALFSRAVSKAKCAILSPNSPHVMKEEVELCITRKTPYFFDPGPVTSGFTRDELRKMIKNSAGLFANEDEFAVIQKILGLDLKQLQSLCSLIIVTLGSKGSVIYFKGKILIIPAVHSENTLDPTGCGDAYRTGFLAEILPHFPRLTIGILKRAGACASRLGTKCLEKQGTQNHSL